MACRVFFKERLWLTVAVAGLDEAVNGPEDDGGFVRVIDYSVVVEIVRDTVVMNGIIISSINRRCPWSQPDGKNDGSGGEGWSPLGEHGICKKGAMAIVVMG